MAYSILCGLPAIYGLYTSFYPPLFYTLFGSSKHIAVGAFSVVSLMSSGTVQRLAVEHCSMPEARTNGTISKTESWFCESAASHCIANPALAVEIALTLTFLMGIFQILLGMLNMGFLSVYLSDQLVEGLTCGAAILVLTSQLPSAFGIKGLPTVGHPFAVIRFYGCFFMRIMKTNWVTLITSAVCIFTLAVTKQHIAPLWKRRLKFPLPIEIIVVIICTIASYLIDLPGNYQVDIVGEVPSGLLPPRLPRWDLISRMVPDAISVGIVAYSICISLAKLFAKKHDYRLLPNQEWFALGLVNTCSSFFSCHPTCASLSRTALQDSQGGQTQVAAVVGALVIMFVLLFLAPFVKYLPKCVLAATILVALRGMLLQLRRLPKLWKCSKPDFLIWIVSFCSIILFDMSYGLTVSFAFVLLTIVFKSQWADSVCLGRLDGSEIYQGLNLYAEAREIRGIKIYRFDSPLFFANVELFKEGMIKRTGIDPIAIRKSKTNAAAGLVAVKTANENDSTAIGLSDIKKRLHTIVIDCSSFPYIDMMGAEVMRQIFADYKRIGVDVMFAACKVSVRQLLQRAGVFDEVPKEYFHPTVHDSVVYALQKNGEYEALRDVYPSSETLRVSICDSKDELICN
ncbi:Prestin [Trichuris trichiura]|uniref:Prestin n=1 Tax=Trichuris trichiura TaxID=36087 RepID=A0A077Z501_TRITR|nr:Prestin [Trichuris trichiura]